MSDPNLEANRELVARCNELARLFYGMQQCVVPDDFKFYEATHPAEVSCWVTAVAAFDFINGDDVEDALAQLEDEDAED